MAGGPGDLYALFGCPGLATHDVVNGDGRDAVLTSKRRLLSIAPCVPLPNLVHLGRGQLSSCASATVLAMGDRLDMVRVHASSNAAQVIEFKPVRNEAVLSLVCELVGLPVLKDAVPVTTESTEPDPAGSREALVLDAPKSRRPLLRIWRLRATGMPKYEPKRLTTNPSKAGAGLGSDRCGLPAAALAKTGGI